MLKKILPIFLSFLVPIGIELVFFNVDVLKLKAVSAERRIYQVEDFQYQNWEKTDTSMISEPDPILYVENVDLDIYTLDMLFRATPMPTQCTFFYTSEAGEVFSSGKMTFLPITDGIASISFPDGVKTVAFRIDLGEEAGTTLDDISVIVNDTSWHISISRVVAMLIIYWGTKSLMCLQKSPDYGLEIKKQEKSVDET